MIDARESSVLLHLATLRSLADERRDEDMQAVRAADRLRLQLVELAESVFSAVESAGRNMLAAERSARKRRAHERRVRARADAERAKVLEAAELERVRLAAEMQVKAELASKTKPRTLSAVVGLLVFGLVALAWWGHGQHREGQAHGQWKAEQLATLDNNIEQSLAAFEAEAREVDDTHRRLLADKAEAEQRAARQAAAAAEADRLAALERDKEVERKRLARERQRRERERLEQRRRAEWERLNSARCAADPLCGVR